MARRPITALFACLALALVGLAPGEGVEAAATARLDPAVDPSDLLEGYTTEDGRYTVYNTTQYPLLPGESAYQNVFVYERATGLSTRISLQPDGTPFNDWGEYLDISSSGRYVLYDLWDGGIYLHDRDLDGDGVFDETGPGALSTIALPLPAGFSPPEGWGNPDHNRPGRHFTQDGGQVIFSTGYATEGGASSRPGVFAYRTATRTSTWIVDGVNPAISADGRFVAYLAEADAGEPLDLWDLDVLRWDRDPDADGSLDEGAPQPPQRVSRSTLGEPADRGVSLLIPALISADGRLIAFTTPATNLAPLDQNQAADVFVHDCDTHTTTRISLTNEGYPLNVGSALEAISQDGRYVAFTTRSDAAAPGDTNDTPDLFLRDRQLNTTTLVTGQTDHNLDRYLARQPAAELRLSGPAEGGLERDYTLTATLATRSGAAATGFTWQVTDWAEITHPVGGASERVTVRWSTPGAKTVRVTAATPEGPVSATGVFQVYPPPVADFSVSTTGIPVLTPVQFTNRSSGRITSGFWDFGDGAQGTVLAGDAEKSYWSPGAYTVSLTVAGPGGISTKTRTQLIHVQGQNPVNLPATFIQGGYQGLPLEGYSSAAWGDYDQDGLPDLLVVGCNQSVEFQTCSQPFARLYANRGGVLEDLHAGLMPIYGSASWVDLDGDGGLEAVTCGVAEDKNVTLVYHPEGHFIAQQVGLPGCAPTMQGSSWADYDRDGDPDAVIYKMTDTGVRLILYENAGGVFQETSQVFPVWDTAAWGDYDQDGWVDLVTVGDESGPIYPYPPKTHLYHNLGGSLSEVASGLPDLKEGAAAWVDYNQDGGLELLLSGQGSSGAVTHLYRYTGSGFSELPVTLPGPLVGPVLWGDVDQDGDLDLHAKDDSTGKIYINQSGQFTELPFRWGVGGLDSLAWVDFNQDGRLDTTAASGFMPYSTEGRIRFYLNNTEAAGPGPVKADFHAEVAAGRAPLTVQFSDDSSGDYTAWAWDFGDGTTSSEAHPAHLYTRAGVYPVRLTVSGPGGTDTRLREAYIRVDPWIYLPWVVK